VPLEPIILGAVAYDPKVVTIWEGFRRYLAARGLVLDYVLYSNYERQVDALLAGHVHVAWNSPLAWLSAERRAVPLGLTVSAFCMRDTDRDNRSVIVARAGSGVGSIQDLRGRRVAVGAVDSPQATLIPLAHLADRGLRAGVDLEVVRHEVLVGLHGNHVGGERDAADALVAGLVDAACLHEWNYHAFIENGVIAPLSTVIVDRTDPYDHCNMTAGPAASATDIERLQSLLLGMDIADPEVRRLFELEGLTRWVPARTSGYGQLAAAIVGTSGAESPVRSTCLPA
jgi:ABC-type phosphate/phosphonate transport system substrate-binding protein